MISKNFTWFFAIIAMLIILQHQQVVSLSPAMQKIALFQFKLSLAIGTRTNTICFHLHYDDEYFNLHYYDDDYNISPSYPKTMNWSMSSDYCTWEGVSCDLKTGDVIGLDLSCSQLEGAILPNSTLFRLSHLRFLNLSQNSISFSNQFSQKIGFFTKGLTHLNLSHSNDYAKLEGEVFKSLLQNLTQLRVLNLASTGLYGVLPQEVFHLPNLELLDLSGNINLTVILPKVKWGSSRNLQHLYLRAINLHGGIPDSIGFLDSLATLGLGYCNLSGSIPRSLFNLSQLTVIELFGNHLNGQIPNLLGNLTNLKFLHLSVNNLIGQFPSFVSDTLFDLPSLKTLDLSDNAFTGLLPPWLFMHPSLEDLDLSSNGFTGQLYEFDSFKSRLQSFSCSNNLISGPIPQSFSQIVNLHYLDFSSNNFSGVLDIIMFSRLQNLDTLDLSHNSLTVKCTSMATLPPKLSYLGLSSCNLKEFPHFSRDAKFIQHLDLSNNQIDGEIPHWIGLMGMDYLASISDNQLEGEFVDPFGSNLYLNLSYNRLTGGLEKLPWKNIRYLDLQSNMFNGSLTSLICNSSSLEILNLSHNNISGVLPICLTNLTSLLVFDLRMNDIQGNIPATLSNFRHLKSMYLHGNKLEGRIPSSFAEFQSLEVLDLGNNQINDTFPQCLEALPNLQVLVLKSNKFHGLINKSSTITNPFPSLRIIDLSYNEFSGPLPATYFKNFKAMMNGDVNKIERSYMGDNAYYNDSLILVIKGVETELVRILTVFTAIDVSMNNFEGEIVDYIGNLVSLRYLNLSHNHLTGHIPSAVGKLSMLESLDLSFNRLKGEIPQLLSSIYTLARLNLSCNQLSGHIPVGSQFNTFGTDSYVGNSGLCGYPLSKVCEHDIETQKVVQDEEDDYFFSGFTWEAVVIGYGCGLVPAFLIGNLMLLAGKPKWFAGIIARELGLKIRRMEIKLR